MKFTFPLFVKLFYLGTSIVIKNQEKKNYRVASTPSGSSIMDSGKIWLRIAKQIAVHTVANDETAANVLIHHTMQMNEQVNYAFQFVQPLPADVDFRRRYQVSFHCYRCWFFLPCRLQVSKLNWNHLRILFHSPIISFVRFPPLHRGFTRVVIFWINALWKILFILFVGKGVDFEGI